MNIKRNVIVYGKHNRPIPADVYIPDLEGPKPVIVFAHGFKGFKDWGIWDLLAKGFAREGYVFLKFNFSHNGTTPDDLLDFVDLEAFGQNNYSLELADLESVFDALEKGVFIDSSELDWTQVALAGHSRGGGTTAIMTARDSRIAAWLGWASVKDLAYSWRGNAGLVNDWKETGVRYIKNSRTQQSMPLYYQLLEDFVAHEDEYSVEAAIRKMDKALLVVHGTADTAVPVSATDSFKEWNAKLKVVLIPDANHVFGGSHPYEAEELPKDALILKEESLAFLSQLRKREA